MPGRARRSVRHCAPRPLIVAALTALLVAACASGDGAEGDPTGAASTPVTSSSPSEGLPAPSPTASATPDAVVVTVTISGGKVSTPQARVDVPRGETVRLVVTSDVADELHVHGYDREAELKPGVPATVEFIADVAGSFEVETHESHLLLLQLLVRP